MWLINLILNFAGLLLWLRWREKNIRALASRSQILLASALKRTRPEKPRFVFFGGLLLLLSVRSIFYWQLGDSLRWIPAVKFGILPLSFRSDFFWRIFAFSFCSFGETLGLFFLTLLFFSIVNEAEMETNVVQKFISAHLGWIDRLPVIAKVILPGILAMALWCVLSPALVATHLLPARKALWQIAAQGALLGAGVYVVWEYVIIATLIFYVLNSYIYFGTLPFWEFIDQTGRRLLKPLSFLSWRVGKIDFAPAVAIAVVLLLCEGLHLGFIQIPSIPSGLAWLYQHIAGR